MHYLGPLRLILAVSVAAFHIWTPLFPDAGRHAVMGFFVISGFLITRIANEVYHDRPGSFLLNRALRIYPTYWVCLILTLAIATLFPATVANHVWLMIPWPQGISGWLTNLFVYDMGSNVRAITPTWSLNIELIVYLVIGLTTFRSLFLTLLGFVISLGWALYGMFHMSDYPFYFYPMGTAFIFFTGSLAYFASKKNWQIPKPLIVACVSAYAVAMFGLPHLMRVEQYSGPIPHLFLFISIISMFVILTALPSLPRTTPKLEAAARLTGDFSYPIFLLHIAFAVPMVAMFGDNRPVAFFGSVAICAVVSYFIIRAETVVEKLRDIIREKNAPPKLGSLVGSANR